MAAGLFEGEKAGGHGVAHGFEKAPRVDSQRLFC